MERTGVIIVAGGSGQRCGGPLPKQFMLLEGEPVLARTINLFAEALPGAQIVVVLPEAYADFWKNLAARFEVAAHTVTQGGAERFHSVRNGLAALTGDEELIAVQDGVRPLGTPDMIRRVAAAAAEYGAAIPVVRPVDSFREIDMPEIPETETRDNSGNAPEKDRPGGAATDFPAAATTASGPVPSRILDRRTLRIVQTPQIFRAELLRRAYDTPFDERFTDDASVVEHAGHPVFLAEGERTNLKITTPEDFTLARAILEARENIPETDESTSEARENSPEKDADDL